MYSALVIWICTTVLETVVTVLMVSSKYTSPACDAMEAGVKNAALVMSVLLYVSLNAIGKLRVMTPP